MNTISHADLKQLAVDQTDRCVSLYLPTGSFGSATAENSVRFKVLVDIASKSLGKQGMNATDVQAFLNPVTELLDRPLFWKTLDHGLAVLISTSGIRVWQLPFECAELCIVGKRFYVIPLVTWYGHDAPFYVLAVSQNNVRFLQGSRYRTREIKVADLPNNLVEALHYDPREGFYQTHSGQPQIRGKEGVVFTGQGGEVDVAKDELNSFFRLIDASISKYLDTRTEPLIFCGVDYLFPIYRRHNHYPRLATQHVAGNPDLASSRELRERAWPIVEALLRERQDDAIARYWEFVSSGRCRNRLEEILIAAQEGAVETLFISPTHQRLGAFDARSQAVRLTRVRNLTAKT